jgi:hypothetical protein
MYEPCASRSGARKRTMESGPKSGFEAPSGPRANPRVSVDLHGASELEQRLAHTDFRAELDVPRGPCRQEQDDGGPEGEVS